MFHKTKRNVALLAGVAGLNLLLGVAVASGVVPQAEPSVTIASEQSPMTTPVEVAAPVAPVEEVVATTVPHLTAAVTITPPTTKAPRAAATTVAPVTAAAPATTPPPTAPPVTLPARLTPTDAQVTAAIQGLSVGLFTPTVAQARQFGDEVCTAFDQGRSFAEVQAGALAKAATVPLVGALIQPAQVASAIRSAVPLFCPGHSSKLA